MSAETKTALDEALARHYADEFPGSYLTNWITVCYGENPDGTAGYLRSWAHAQPGHVTAGLIDYAATRQKNHAD